MQIKTFEYFVPVSFFYIRENNSQCSYNDFSSAVTGGSENFLFAILSFSFSLLSLLLFPKQRVA